MPFLLSDPYWQPGWVEPELGAWNQRVAELIERDSWVMDGNYGNSLPVRLTRADAVVWLDFSTAVCLRRALGRIVRSFGRVRPDMAPGCPEKFDLEFVVFVLQFRAKQRGKILAALASFPGTVIVARNPREAEALF